MKLKADAYYYKYDFRIAAEHYMAAALKEKEQNGEASLFYAERLGDAGFCYYRMVDYPNAVKYYKQALKYTKKDRAKLEKKIRELTDDE